MAKKERNSKVDKHSELSKIRHSASHILAEAVQRLFPKTKLAFGPATDDGFYYDFEFETPITDADLAKLEKEMDAILKAGRKFEQSSKSVAEAKAWAEEANQPYKLEQINELAEQGETELSFYTSGPFMDLCSGPHVEEASSIGAIKLLSLAGAYWKGDENNKQLTRIYGTAYATKEELAAYLEMLEEAKKRDHRKLGKELDLYTFSDLVGPGLPLFTPKGTMIRELVVQKIQGLQADYGYQRVTIPHITKKDLYETSGHWAKFKDDLFHVSGKSKTEFVMKPMNCPHHTQIFASKPRSYKELPLRFMETTMVYRDEQPGELMGLSRVRSISQDDGHVFCTLEQAEQEVINIVKVIKSFYSDLGMFNEGQYRVSLSVRDPQTPEKYLGEDANWNKAEEMLESVAKSENLDYERVEGEAAFYGPKLDFMFKDSLGREWQLGTAQIDFVMPERFDLQFTDSDGENKHPVMIHRAIAGSLERFMAIMIEHFAGAFPLWLSPEQVRVMTINESFLDYANEVADKLKMAGYRVQVDGENNSIGKKIRGAQLEKVPYMLIIGEKEASDKVVAVRLRDGSDMGTMSVEELVNKLGEDGKANQG
ncbi:MAG: threonine--tRNA ligase [Patescibacteria group bacterium]